MARVSAAEEAFEVSIGGGYGTGYEYADPYQFVMGSDVRRQFPAAWSFDLDVARRFGNGWSAGISMQSTSFAQHVTLADLGAGLGATPEQFESDWTLWMATARGTVRGLPPWHLFAELGAGVAHVRTRSSSLIDRTDDVLAGRLRLGLRASNAALFSEVSLEGVLTPDLSPTGGRRESSIPPAGEWPDAPRGLRQGSVHVRVGAAF